MKPLKESILGNVGLDVNTVFKDEIEECRLWIERKFKVGDLSFEMLEDGCIVANANNAALIPYKDRARAPLTLTNGKFKWGKVDCFKCAYCKKLTSLEGAPKECKLFYCTGCDNLTSLEGAPKECKEFDCSWCPKLASLEDGPEKCDEFKCEFCDGLSSLRGAPKKCEEFYCDWCKNLESLKGTPKECKTFDCSFCRRLSLSEKEILKYKQKYIEFTYYAST